MPVYPWMIEAILLAIMIEFGFGVVVLTRLGLTAWIRPFAWFLASGTTLMVGVHEAMTGQTGWRLAVALLASLICHGVTIWAVLFARRGRARAPTVD